MASIKANCRKVMCIGRNYAEHITELKNQAPSKPFFFLKPPSSILPPPHTKTPILIPRGTKVHYEVELGLVIGHPPSTIASSSSSPQQKPTPTPAFSPLKNLRFPAPSEPASSSTTQDPKDETALVSPYIKSYILAIDLTARNLQDEAKRKGLPWTTAKGFDTFLPISLPIPPSKIPDPHNVTLSLSVNGTTKQHDNTDLMIFRIPRILSDISKVMSIEEGDVVITGTPKGVGEIKAGDRVVCTLEVEGKEVEEARIEILVEDAPGEEEGGYVFAET